MSEAKRTPMMGIFGCSGETMGRIAKTLGMTEEELANRGLDLDVLDTARWVSEQGLDIGAVEGLGWPPGFRDAVAIAAGNLQITSLDSGDD